MRKIICFVAIVVNSIFVSGQNGYNTSKLCNDNPYENEFNWNSADQEGTAEILIIFPGSHSCSGTLLNQNTDGVLRQYFLTAWHCFKDGDNCGGNVIVDNNTTLQFAFNYQSPGEDNEIPLDARGRDASQSQGSPTQSRFRYLHTSRVRQVRRLQCTFGDMALYEIIDQIPPHFKPYFAGWTPSMPLPNKFLRQYHHPKSDIKKLAHISMWVPNANPVARGCRTITRVIDYLFGWIWRRRFSTEVVCNYVDIPVINISAYDAGNPQSGSSGSGIFKQNDGKLFSNFTTSTDNSNLRTNCNKGLEIFLGGKFQHLYNLAVVKNALNPKREGYVDVMGIMGRGIECYDNLPNLKGEYFPRQDYLPTYRLIDIRSRNEIATTTDFGERLEIHKDAEVLFQAANGITLNPGFNLQPGATLTAEISNYCLNRSNLVANEDTRSAITEIDDINSNLVSNGFKPESYAKTYLASYAGELPKVLDYVVYPNPSNDGVFNVSIKNYDLQSVQVIVYTTGGVKLKHEEVNSAKFELDLSYLTPGYYIVKLQTGTNTHSEKLTIL